MTLDQASVLRQRASRLLAEARRLEAVLLGHGPLVRGSLIQRPKFCGKAPRGGSSCRAVSQPSGGRRGSAPLRAGRRPGPGNARG